MNNRRRGRTNQYDAFAIKNILRGNTKRLRPVFSELRRELNTSDFPAVIRDIYHQPFYQQKLFGHSFPKDIAQLKQVQPLNSAGLGRDLLWNTALVSDYATQISKSLVLKKQITNAVLFGDKNAALAMIDSAPVDLGISLWVEELRIFLTNEVFGTDKKKRLVRSYFSTKGINGLAYYILYYFGFRVEQGASLKQIRDGLAQLNNLHSYLIYKLIPFDIFQKTSERQLEGLLRYESNSSLLDIYGTLCRVLQLIVADHALLRDYRDTALKCVKTLSAKIPDQRLQLLNILLDADEKIPDEIGTRRALVLEDTFVRNDFRFEPNEVVGLILSAYSPSDDAPSVASPIVRQRADRLLHVINADSVADTEFAELERSSSVASALDFFWGLYSVANKARFGRSSGLFGDLLGALNSGAYFPDIAEHLNDPIRSSKYLERLTETYGEHLSIEFFSAQISQSQPNRASFGPSARHWLTINCGEIVDSARLLNYGQTKQPHSGLDGPIFHKTIALLLDQQQLAIALELVVARYLYNPFAWPQLPLDRIASIMGARDESDKSDLAVPIFWDIYARHVDPKLAQRRAYAVEDCWEAAGVERPSALLPPSNQQRRGLYIYYLDKLCVPSILDESDIFQKASDVDQERIRICQVLAEHDTASSELYQAEIRSITRRLIIQEGLRRVEQSKIYVGVNDLYKELITSLSTDFDRLVALQRNKTVAGDLSELVKSNIRLYRDDEITGQLMLSIQQERPDTALLRIMLRIWKEFASNSHHGLDVYLSTRIRHGTLTGHLRRPFEEQSLICQRDAVSGQYRDQPYWSERLRGQEPNEISALQTLLKNFSAEIDTDIIRLNTENLRVRLAADDKGWFSFVPTDAQFVALQSIVDQGVTTDDFVVFCLTLLWRRLDAILKVVRQELALSLRSRWVELLTSFRDQVQTLWLGNSKYELDTAIVRAQAGVVYTLDRVSNWFTLSSTTSNPDYTVDLAIEIAAESARNCFGMGTVTVTRNETTTPMLAGNTLASFVDLFFILIENGVKHARPEGKPCVLDIQVSEQGGLFSIFARNDLPQSSDLSALRLRIAAIKESLEDNARDVVAMEGGSGFHKLRKIIFSDLGSENTFDFEVKDGAFVVTIVFDARRILA